ncbi:hypothetical protein H9Y04_31400 [Streptomyces sp. TRM66268-LWL]|uniref:Uncharacterized protein n=1 Tax=Streptomyces polyasparticus TaxID=2767826 RepID=A0ABR7SNP3_9ACTN|nr:Rid family hydrolase [Streptomyces polyasparticus]MBC9717048.1 hypothetical protein [Streptomyces polyasparticus]
MKRRNLLITAAGAGTALLASGTAYAAHRGWIPRPWETKVMLPAGQNNPSIAGGVAMGEAVPQYISSGLGPDALNPAAPAGTPERYTDPALTAGATGVTVTEAQALVVLGKISANLAAAGLTASDVVTMKCYLMKPPGAALADYAGWNRAYRQFYANVDLASGAVVDVPMGTSAPKPPLAVNKARPARATLEVTSLAVPGWLVEVEVSAVYTRR